MQRLGEVAFPEIARVARAGRALTILPVGVVEEHGPHLPLGLDSFAAETYATAAAPHLEEQGYEVLIAPTIHYGVARAAIDFPGTLSLEPETLHAMVLEIGRSLVRHGLIRLAILNGHRDRQHMQALDGAARALSETNGAQALCVGFAHDASVTAACFRAGIKHLYRSQRPDREGHGGESETSVALYAFPQLVNRDIISQLSANFDYDVDAFRNETMDYGRLTAGCGYFGSPQAASADTGRLLIKIRGRNIANLILEAWGKAKTD
jgi:creatinine amidohydrolase